MTQFAEPRNVDELRLGHWPHAASRLRDELDLSHLEDQAIRILARATRTERLVAFVGAGASVAYGRLAWANLMRSLFESIEHGPKVPQDHETITASLRRAKASKAWRNASQYVWDGLHGFTAYGDHVIKAQILDMALRASVSADPADPAEVAGPDADGQGVRDLVKQELEDFHGFLRSLVFRWHGKEGRACYRKLVANEAARSRAAGPQRTVRDGGHPWDARGLRGVLNVLLGLPSAAGDAVAEASTPGGDVERLYSALSRQSVGVDSPLSSVVRDWSIRRFVTTNYDHEIERALEAQGFARAGSRTGPASGNMQSSVNFGRTQSAQALKLAFEGPRRHAEILHLHGNVSQPRSLVLTEEQYQRLYLQEHPTRDLITNAALAVFAANPIIFIGSDAGEEDVIRPMRQFMTGEGHRSDRMAVALFPALKARDERAKRAVTLLLRHGVYAVHFGWATAGLGGAERFAGDKAEEPWLHTLQQLYDELQNAANAKKKPSDLNPKDWLKKFLALAPPAYMDGAPIVPKSELDLEPYLTPLHTLAKMTLEGRRKLPAGASRTSLDLFLLKLEVFKDWAVSAFLCAKLKTLRERVRTQVDDDAKLALVYTRPNDAVRPATWPDVVVRHQVSLHHPWFESRFAQLQPDRPTYHGEREPFDEGLSALRNHIERTDHIRHHSGRRLLLICGARGHGKGGQSDRLGHALMVASASDRSSMATYPDLERLRKVCRTPC